MHLRKGGSVHFLVAECFVKQFRPLVLVVSLFLSSAGCGYVSIRGAIEPATNVQGAVVEVQIANVQGEQGETVQVTNVTFLETGISIEVGFCGDQTALFPVGKTVSVNFNPGAVCAAVIVVVTIV